MRQIRLGPKQFMSNENRQKVRCYENDNNKSTIIQNVLYVHRHKKNKRSRDTMLVYRVAQVQYGLGGWVVPLSVYPRIGEKALRST